MTLLSILKTNLSAIGAILAVMAAVALLETAVPLHLRDVRETDSDYGNIFSWFDRLFGTDTPSWRGTTVVCRLDGFDDPSVQTTSGLLALPFRSPRSPRGDGGGMSQQPAGHAVSHGGGAPCMLRERHPSRADPVV